jgi:hypothetical protein
MQIYLLGMNNVNSDDTAGCSHRRSNWFVSLTLVPIACVYRNVLQETSALYQPKEVPMAFLPPGALLMRTQEAPVSPKPAFEGPSAGAALLLAFSFAATTPAPIRLSTNSFLFLRTNTRCGSAGASNDEALGLRRCCCGAGAGASSAQPKEVPIELLPPGGAWRRVEERPSAWLWIR